MIEHLLQRIREWLGRTDHTRARSAEKRLLARANPRLPKKLERELERLAAHPNLGVELGQLRLPVEGAPFRVAFKDLLAHLLCLGMTGAGKSSLMLLLLRAILDTQAGSVCLLDMKGDTAGVSIEQLLPSIAVTLGAQDRQAFLDRIVVIDPFHPQHLPPLNILARDPHLPIEVQARDIAECFETANGIDVTARMENILDWMFRLVIEVGGSFHTVRRALDEPLVLEALVRQSRDRETIRYFLTRYPAEPKASKLGLLARLDRFLALPDTRLCLGAQTCLDFDRLLQNKIVIVNLGNAPAGMQSVARFWASILLTRYVRAIFRRSPRGNNPPALLLADEWQIALTPSLAAEFESILTLARSRNVFAWLFNQQLQQLDQVRSGLRSVVLGQAALQVGFCLAEDDAKSLKHLIPITGAMPRRARSPWAQRGSEDPFLSPTEELEARLKEATKLPQRAAYWTDKRRSGSEVQFETKALNLPDPSTFPRSVVDATMRGSQSHTRAELTQMLRAEDARLDGLIGRGAQGPVKPPPSPPKPAIVQAPLPKPPPQPSPLPRVRRPKGGPNLG